LKLFDYLAAGRAVVASEIPSIRELIKGSGAIVPVPPDSPHHLAEAIIGLLKDPAKRGLMGESGRRFIESGYGWNQVARAVASLGQPKKQ
jgi:glycosyltransferase involved in cell wall biosynthesis